MENDLLWLQERLTISEPSSPRGMIGRIEYAVFIQTNIGDNNLLHNNGRYIGPGNV